MLEYNYICIKRDIVVNNIYISLETLSVKCRLLITTIG